MDMCWGSLVPRLLRLQGSSHSPSSRRSWQLFRWRLIQTRLKYMRYLLIPQRVREIETQRQASIQFHVPPLGCPISPRPYVLWRSGGIYVHEILTVPATSYAHWSNHFKGFYNIKKIPHLLLNMADNYLCILYSQHILKYRGNHYP